MRPSLSILAGAALVAGCAGHIADRFGPKTSILAPELVRYGLDPARSECVGDRLAANLNILQLRKLARSAGAVQRSYFGFDRIGVGDLIWVAKAQKDAKVSLEVEAAVRSCATGTAGTNIAAAPVTPAPSAPGKGTALSPAQQALARQLPQTPPATSAPAVEANNAARPATWLNLGAAPTGQAIAVDASSIESGPNGRKAWFRLTSPGAAAPSDTSYLLRIDCTARTLSTLAAQTLGPNGAIGERRDYGPNGEGVLPIENGTVMEIAYLAVCT